MMNPPCEVRFAGWVSDTCKLGRSGWEVSLEDDPYLRAKRLMLHHKESRLVAMAECREFDVFGWRQRGQMMGDLPVFTVRHIASNITVRYEEVLLPSFSTWADTQPTMIREMSIFEHPLFLAKGAPKAQELIVEPQDVMTLLDQIKRMQAPEQAAIRERQRRDTPPTAHATILSFAA